MKNYSAKEIKNIVLIGAPGTGKTTLAEAMAFEGKVIDRRGSIEANNTLSDNTDIEHEYKRSIYSTILFTEFMDRKLNIIDCPGSDDFCGSLFSAFKVGDVGVFLFNAQNGWEVGSEIQARYARLLQKPVIGVVNQLDAEKASFEATVESIRASSRVKPVIVQYPVNQGPEFNAFIDVLLMKMYRFKDNDGHREELEIPAEELEKAQELNKELVEMAAEHDEALMELYFDKGTLTQDDIRSGLKIGVSKREVMPIFCTSGKRDIGTKRLMEFIINVAPGPQKAPAFLSTEGEEITADETAPAVAFVFKSQVEQHHLFPRHPRQDRRGSGVGEHPHRKQGKTLAAVRRGGQEPDQGHGTHGRRHRLHGEAEGHADERHAFGPVGSRDDRTDRLPRAPLPRRHQMQGPGRRGETGQGAQRRQIRRPDHSGRILQRAEADHHPGSGRTPPEHPALAHREGEQTRL